MNQKHKEGLIARLKRRKENLEYNEADDLTTRAGRIEKLYSGPTPRSRSFRSRAKLIKDDVKKEVALIEQALADLEKDNSEKARQVLKRKMPDWSYPTKG